MKKFYTFLMIAVALSFSIHAQDNCSGNWLSTQGNKLVDSSGNEVYLAGVNWFGFETQNNLIHGLWSRDMYSVLQQSKDLGFNCFRIPWHNLMLRDGSEIYEPNQWVQDILTDNSGSGPYSNLYLQGITKPIDVLDKIVEWCQENDMKIILDCHSRNPDGYLAEGLWYTDTVSDEEWIADWVFIANRYKNYDAVIAMDINNEPHGKIDDPEGSRWGNDDVATDWRLAAERCGNAILEANPNVLIMVEGIEAYTKPDGTETTYWWGGNLQGARDFPVRLSDPSKLMYSPHEYGPTVFAQPWFDVPEFPENLPAIWEEQFNFLNTAGTSPLFVGELGIKTREGKDEEWFAKFIDYIKEEKLHFTFWSLNPNSGDTGGILADDWKTVVQWKMDYLQPILADPIPNCSSVLSVVDTKNIDISSIQVYPNPAKDVINIVSNQNLQNTKVTLADLTGKLIISATINNENQTKLAIENITSGLYLVTITGENGQNHIQKIVVN